LFYCKFGVEVPIESEKQGFIPVDVARSRAARCANEAAWTTLMAATPATPLGIACEQFKTLYGLTFGEAVLGSRVTHTCHPGVKPVILTPRSTPPR
jgi:hypothetical protein